MLISYRQTGIAGGRLFNVPSSAQIQSWTRRNPGAIEIPQISRYNHIPDFDGSGSDDQTSQWQIYPPRCLVCVNPGNNLSRAFGDRMDGNLGYQTVDEPPAPAASLNRIGAIDPVSEFGNCQRANGNWDLTDRRSDVLNGFERR